ncbi:MAG TPA: hypothetical protein QF710_02290 [Candidatus Nitrosopelagicus sp.]|jgi:hypothetical protein|nr:hypothetical protein [Candidatus Nitrosopelagicus sp.]|tara:strand:+ start:170 stop:553 length:384 start_codon:yes stop_codon:yes gene_type:complete
MKESETFGAEEGSAEIVVKWMNEEAERRKAKFEARLYGYVISTENFGKFEMFSWMGDVKLARNLITKASKRFKAKVIEGGYKTKDKVYSSKKSDYAMVRKGDRVIGHLQFSAPRFGGDWELVAEERK